MGILSSYSIWTKYYFWQVSLALLICRINFYFSNWIYSFAIILGSFCRFVFNANILEKTKAKKTKIASATINKTQQQQPIKIKTTNNFLVKDLRTDCEIAYTVHNLQQLMCIKYFCKYLQRWWLPHVKIDTFNEDPFNASLSKISSPDSSTESMSLQIHSI